jgi:alpha-1,6-mannosyltransferase
MPFAQATAMRAPADHRHPLLRRELRPVSQRPPAWTGFGSGFDLVGSRSGASASVDPPERPPLGAGGAHVVDATMFWSASGGGVGRYVRAKDAWLQQQPGWRHTVVVPHAAGQRAAEDHCVSCGGLPLPGTGGYHLPLGRARAARLIESLAPDLIEAGDPYQMAWSVLDAARRLQVPAVMFCHSHVGALVERLVGGGTGGHGHGLQAHCARWARRAAEAYLLRTCREFDLVLAPSEAMANDLRQMGVSAVQHQPLGVDTQVFRPQARDAIWRHSLGLPANARVLLYAGRFAPEKNLPLLVEAVQSLGRPYWLLAIGGGPLPPSGERVRVLPYERHAHRLARVMASVDGFVHAGNQETFGLGVLEAMACGTPVAACHAGGLAELLAGNTGVGVMTQRVGDWAEAIESLFTPRRSHWVQAGLERARAHAWPVVLAELQRRYLRLRRSDGLHAGEFAVPEVAQPCAGPGTGGPARPDPQDSLSSTGSWARVAPGAMEE